MVPVSIYLIFCVCLIIFSIVDNLCGKCKIGLNLCLIFATEPSPLEPHLPQDITILLLFMEAACLFLVKNK